jgi:hypothetical protein
VGLGWGIDMDIDEIQYKLKMGKIEVQEVEHLLDLGCMVITYRESSGLMDCRMPPKPLPDTFYRVVYSYGVMNIQTGVENITPEFREIVYD